MACPIKLKIQSKPKEIGNYVVPAPFAVPGRMEATTVAEARLRAQRALARKSRSTGTVADWLSVVIQMAPRKRNVKGAQLAGKLIG